MRDGLAVKPGAFKQNWEFKKKISDFVFPEKRKVHLPFKKNHTRAHAFHSISNFFKFSSSSSSSSIWYYPDLFPMVWG